MSKKKLCENCIHLINLDETPKTETGMMMGNPGTTCKLLNWYMADEREMAVKCKYHTIPEPALEPSVLINHVSEIIKRVGDVEDMLTKPEFILPEKLSIPLEELSRRIGEIRKSDKPSGEPKVFNIQNATIN